MLSDDFDPIIVAAFQRQPPELTPIQALRGAFHEAFGALQPDQIAEQSDRMDMMLAVSELRAAMLEQFAAAWRHPGFTPRYGTSLSFVPSAPRMERDDKP